MNTHHGSLSPLSLELVQDDGALAALAPQWDALLERCPGATIFHSWDYVSLAWKHSRQPGDRLMVLVLREGTTTRAIAPFRKTKVSYHGIPVRQVEWIAAWEGDRPTLLCDGDPTAAWARLARFFGEDYRQWDVLRLQEQSVDDSAGAGLDTVSAVHRQRDSVGYYIDLAAAGNFESYLDKINAKVKANWRNRARRLAALDPPPAVERLSAPEEMSGGVARFIALESASWKGEAHLGMGHDETHHQFYVDLTRTLATKGRAEFRFLRQGEHDLAAVLLFSLGNVVYERHIAFHPSQASLSPGIALRVELVKELFDGPWTQFDMLGLDPAVGRQRHKVDWATHQRETVTVLFVRRRGRMYLAWTATRLGRRLLARWRAGRAPSQAPGEAQVAA